MIYHDVIAAYQRIEDHIVHTPLAYSPALSAQTGAEVYLKCEHVQHTGSFKLRGALSKASSIDPATRAGGVITASSGNHGMAVSYAGRIMGMKAHIFVPESISPAKEQTILALGGNLTKVAGSSLDAELAAAKAAQDQGLPFVSPYNDPEIIAGQGTVGLEMVADKADLDQVYISVGGGGLISGVAGYLNHTSPQTKVFGCWPSNAPAMADCLKAGKIYDVIEQDTLSDGTAGGVEPDAITFTHCQNYMHDEVRVSEDEIIAAMRLLATEERWIVEGAAAVALASFLKRAQQQDMTGQRVAIVLCGRNIAFDKFLSLMT